MFKLILYSVDSTLDGLLNKSSHDFVCKAVRHFQDLQQQLQTIEPHVLIIAGKNSFIEDSLPLIRQLNYKADELGLIFIASEYSLHLDQECFLNGADHFLLQQTPFHMFEARLKNLCKKIEKIRTHTAAIHLPKIGRSVPQSEIEVSSDKRMITYRGASLQLSPIHHALVLTFLSHADRLLTREDLLQLVWKGQKISSRSIDAQISKLKKTVPYFETNIMNLYGRGYVFTSNKKAAA